MQVIRVGDGAKVYIAECCSCKSLIAYQISEEQHLSYVERGYKIKEDYIVCPICKQHIVLFTTKL